MIILMNARANAAQGHKTVYADPWNTSMRRAFVAPNQLNYDTWVACLFATIDTARIDDIDIVDVNVVFTSMQWRSLLRS